MTRPPDLLYLQVFELKVQILSHDGEVEEVKGHCAGGSASILILTSKPNLLTEQREVGLMGE